MDQEPQLPNPLQGWQAYSTRDWTNIAVISAISAVAYAGVGQLWAMLTAATGPLGGAFLGLFQFGHVIAGGLIRKRGVVLVTSVISTVIQAFLGDPAGFYVIGWGIAHGIGAEAVFLSMSGYSRPTPLVFMLAAGIAAVAGHFFSYALYGWEPAMYLFVVSIPILFVSSAVESGLLGYFVCKRVGKAIKVGT